MARALANAERARLNPPPPEPEPTPPPRNDAGMDEAVALLRAAFPIWEQQTWRVYQDVGWVCRETGEVSATMP